MDDKSRTTYDQTPYPSLSYSQSHPDRLAVVATLLGMQPAPARRCRVLELGCASGGNLSPMANGLPESEFVGLDSSARQIAEGSEIIEAVGLRNVSLRQGDILDVGPDLGLFDYIIAHGVFSWVPRPVQEKLLEICKQNLAPNGVAYVSYNTYPGWHFLGIVRDMMLYHTRETTDPQERAAQARVLLDFLADSIPAENSVYGSFLNTYAEFLRGDLKGPRPMGDAFLLHDELEEINSPVYFHQFAERAADHGLQYLGEAEFSAIMGSRFSPQSFERINQIASSVIDLEQYMDFLRNQTFRQTLLCHQGIEVSRKLGVEQAAAFSATSRAQPVEADADIHSVSVVKFRGPDRAVLTIDHPVTKAAMICLAEVWPRAVPFDALLSMARAHLGLNAKAQDAATVERDRQVLAANLLRAFGYSASLVELHLHPPNIMSTVSARPKASALCRHQAQRDPLVTNLRHERVRLEQVDRYLLLYLDGGHDQDALVDRLMAGPVAEGILKLQQDGQTVEEPQRKRDMLAEGVGKRLRWLARAALLDG